ncbi:MAG: hypothetical protein J6P41_01550 [Prevotella sp.]|nr:hypothetical protein [Prevotella sp.]
MKKTYLKPEVAVETIELQHIITTSGNEVYIDPNEQGDPTEADSRLIDDMLGLPFGL